MKLIWIRSSLSHWILIGFVSTIIAASQLQDAQSTSTSAISGSSLYLAGAAEYLDFSMPSYDNNQAASKPKAEAPSFGNPFADFDFSLKSDDDSSSSSDNGAAEAAAKAEEKAAAEKKAAEAKKADEKAAKEAAKQKAEDEAAAKKAEKEARRKAELEKQKAAVERAKEKESVRISTIIISDTDNYMVRLYC